MVSSYEDRTNKHQNKNAQAAAMAGVNGGVAGVAFAFMVVHAGRWPQPLLTLVVAAGAIIAGVNLERPPDAPPDRVNAAPGPAPAPGSNGQPPKAQPPKAEPPKPP